MERSEKRCTVSRRAEMAPRHVAAANTTVQMAYIMPILFALFVLIIHTAFYYHDKIILNGIAGETAALGSQAARWEKMDEQPDLEGFFTERAEGKLLLFSGCEVSVEIADETVLVEARAEKGKMRLHIRQRAQIMNSEERLRYENHF